MQPVDLDLQRPFGWGVLMLSDAHTNDTPLSLDSGPVAATPGAVAVKVRHAQDVEFDGLDDDEEVPLFVVNVSMAVGPSRDSGLAFDGVLDLPSGTLLIGDADREDVVTIDPGLYRVQIWLDDWDYAENVRIALTSADEG